MLFSFALIIIICALIVLIVGDYALTKWLADRNWKIYRPRRDGMEKIIKTGRIVGVAIFSLGAGCGTAAFFLLPHWALSHPPTGQYKCVTGTIVVDGSTALQPLVQIVADDYHSQCKGARITVSGSTSGQGLTDVEGDTNGVVIGDSDTLADASYKGLDDHQVTVVIFCVIVNKSVDVSDLTTDQLKDIYNGKVTNWNQIEGSKNSANLPIIPVSRSGDSGTRRTFDDYILEGSESSPLPTIVETKDLIKYVQAHPGAIGYADLYDVMQQQGAVNYVSIDGTTPTSMTVENNNYKFWSVEHMYTKQGNVPDLALALINYMGSDRARELAKDHSYVNLADMSVAALNAHC